MAQPLPVAFVAGASGAWKIASITAVVGDGLPSAERLGVIEGPDALTTGGGDWRLRGMVSNLRYTNRPEVDALGAVQEGLRRSGSLSAALIPIRKSEAWWALAQDERRAIFEEKSKHISVGMAYLPAVARRLHHSRDLGEPFDFLTWFEFAPEHDGAFNDMLGALRSSEEWRYVDREVDIRLSRD